MKTLRIPALGALLLLSANLAADNILILNEGQYGKASGSLNRFEIGASANPWTYDAFSIANPDSELGTTPCDISLHNGEIYIVSKAAQDPGSPRVGGILTAIDRETLRMRAQLTSIDPQKPRISGRAFIGINPNKGYLSTSHGIYTVNLADLSIGSLIAGSENPFGYDEKPIADPTGSQYHGQCGIMVKADGKVFAAHQEKGILVIDPATDAIISTISTDFAAAGSGIGSLAIDRSGRVWGSLSADTTGENGPLGILISVDSSTLATSSVTLPDDILPPVSCWAAWTPTSFKASPVSDCLYWGGSMSNWVSPTEIYSYDTARDQADMLVSTDDGLGMQPWKLCEPSLGIDPASGKIFATLFKDYASKSYIIRSYDPLTGAVETTSEMEAAYWFSGPMLFPDAPQGGIAVIAADNSSAHMTVRFTDGTLSISNAPATATEAMAYDMTGRIIARIPLRNGSGSISRTRTGIPAIIRAEAQTVKAVI